jgi:hypothetical protein
MELAGASHPQLISTPLGSVPRNGDSLTSSALYPAWLAEALLEDALPWPEASTTTLPTFFAAYTLHDSSWITLDIDTLYDGGARAVLHWDTHWTKGRIPYPGDLVAHWPILILKFERVQSISLDGYEGDWPSRGVSAASTEAVSADQHRTLIDDHYGGRIELLHAPRVDVLCLDSSGQVQSIPDLDAA